jgi:hypothetical protein
VADGNTFATKLRSHASCAVSFLPNNNISDACK